MLLEKLSPFCSEVTVKAVACRLAGLRRLLFSILMSNIQFSLLWFS
jgi:hypothetical protein